MAEVLPKRRRASARSGKAAKMVRMAGRPAGNETTREKILEHARMAFGANGYGGASVRTIAASVGVDPSTIIHFFGTKDGLFRAVVKDVARLSEPLIEAFRQRASGEEVVRTYLAIWEDEEASAGMRAVVRTSLGSDEAMGLLREALTQRILDALDWTEPLEAELVVMQLIGIGLGRYLARLKHLAEADPEAIAKRVGPWLDHLLSPKASATGSRR